MDVDRFVFAQNVMWGTLGLAVALFMAVLIYRKREMDDGAWMMLGILLVSLGGAIHRGYWAVWRLFRYYGQTDVADWMVTHNTAITFLAVAIIVCGYVMHMRIALKLVHDRHWFAIGAAAAATVMLLAFFFL